MHSLLIPLAILALSCATTICLGAPNTQMPIRIPAQVHTDLEALDAASIPQNGLVFGTEGSTPIHATSSLATIIYGQVQLGGGDQPQQFNLAFDSLDIATYVFDANDCDNKDWCDSITKFNTSASLTYMPDIEPFVIPYDKERNVGKTGIDLLSMGGFKFFNKFGVFNANLMQDKQGKRIKWPLQADGILSLAYASPEIDFSPTPLGNYFHQQQTANNKLLSIWIEAGNVNGTAQLTIGAEDADNCKNEWTYVNVAPAKGLGGRWTMPLDGFGFKMDAQLQYYNFTDSPQTTVLNTASMQIIGPKKYVYEIFKYGIDPNNVTCNRENLPVLIFNIDGKEYYVTPQQYIIDYKPELNECLLGLVSWDGEVPTGFNKDTTWSLGHAFLRSYCTVLDYSESQKRVGLSPPNSATAVISSLAILLLSLLATFAQKFNTQF